MNQPQTAYRFCVVCGARVSNPNPAANTCDSICTRARNKGRSRYEQLCQEAQDYRPRMIGLGWNEDGQLIQVYGEGYVGK